MKKLALALAAIAVLGIAAPVHAEDRMLGTITKLDVQADGAVAVLKDARSGQLVELRITDDVTLAKFKDRRIVVGDEIKAKFDKQDGKNQATYFKKAAGC